MSRRAIPESVESGGEEAPHDLFDHNALAQICDDLLVFGRGRREIEPDRAELLAEDEAREIAEREVAVSARKRQLRDLNDEEEESNSEDEETRLHKLRELEREIEVLGDSVRAPESDPMDLYDRCLPEPTGYEIVEPPTEASKAVMWEPSFAERALRAEELRCNFVRIYPGELDQRHAVIRALLSAAGPRPSLGLRPNEDLARTSLMLFTRKMEDDLFRTPKSRERYCKREYNCEMYKAHGKIARECLDGEAMQEFERSGNLPEAKRLCLGCMRFDVTWYWMYLRWHGEETGASFISSHYNLTNIRGEYLQDQCLLDGTRGLPLHVVAFNAGAFAPREDTIDGESVVVFVQKLVILDRESDFA